MILKALLISWLWCSFEPIGYVLDEIKPAKVWQQFLIDHVQCPKCIGFWLGFAMTQNIYHAIIVSICTLLLTKLTKHT